MSPLRRVPEDIPDLLAQIDEHLATLPAALDKERAERKRETKRIRRIQTGVIGALVVLALVVGAVWLVYRHGENNRKAAGKDARCAIRAAMVSLGEASPKLDAALAKLDRDLGTGNCPR